MYCQTMIKKSQFFGKISDVSVFTTKTRLRITTLTINDDTGLARAKWFGPQYIACLLYTSPSPRD